MRLASGEGVRRWWSFARRGPGASIVRPDQLLLVVGVQKSGTTMLMRMLEQTGMVASPFRSEGDDFWGNRPPFSPSEYPAGWVYQREGGDCGHEIGPADATLEVRAELEQRLGVLPEVSAPVVVNKNPFNTVRLPWLRALLPEARIVAMVRQPVPNVFSLLKKHTPHKGAGFAPEDGWWGVKPQGWRGHTGDDVLSRCAWQWSEVNRKLAGDRHCVDQVIAYQDLCREPTRVLERILGRGLGAPIPPVRCFDDEFRHGSRLRSKNRSFLETSSLEIPPDERVEIQALEPDAAASVEAACAGTRALFPELA